MKAGIEHWVPLSAGAIDVLNRVCPDPKMRTGPIFKYRERPLSDAAFRVVMARLGKKDFKPHGMRATFRTWGAEETRFENEALEHSLAHGLDPKSVRARYIRGTLMKKRRHIMAAWSQHCNGKPIPKQFDANENTSETISGEETED
jgi:integrase